jgi:hypothetical protein
VEYLTRIEQGRDRNPSPSVVHALADALSLDIAERQHLRYLAKISAGECAAHPRAAPPRRDVRRAVLDTLKLLDNGIAVVTNRLGDLLAYTPGYATVMGASGLLDEDEPNLTRYVFTHPAARTFFADWDDVADEQAFDLWLAPSIENSQWLSAELAPIAGPEFTRRLHGHLLPRRGVLRLDHPAGYELRLRRETLELPADQQQLVVLLPADEETAAAVERTRRLRVVPQVSGRSAPFAGH